MPLSPDDPRYPDEDFKRLVRQANMDKNGRDPNVLPPGIKPKPSGYRCRRCGQMADQKVVPDPNSIIGAKFLLNRDVPQMLGFEPDNPNPVSVIAPEIVERDAKGNPTKAYVTIHCFNCFNVWQRRKMMEDIRANVPQLEYVGVDDAADPA